MKNKITKKQRVELDFMRERAFKIFPHKKNITTEEEKEYLLHTVNGQVVNQNNVLFQAKRHFDITIKMWIEDLKSGLLFISELEEDPNLYIRHVAKGIKKNLPVRNKNSININYLKSNLCL